MVWVPLSLLLLITHFPPLPPFLCVEGLAFAFSLRVPLCPLWFPVLHLPSAFSAFISVISGKNCCCRWFSCGCCLLPLASNILLTHGYQTQSCCCHWRGQRHWQSAVPGICCCG